LGVADQSAQPNESERHVFRRRHRLSHRREFEAAYEGRVRAASGPLVVFAAANGLAHPRLGLSVGRRVGGAVRRHRIKRLLRESFRLEMAQLPAGYDLVVNVRPHGVLPLEAYRRLLVELAARAARTWEQRRGHE
jgi:ribonuclease P protein component